MAKKCTCIAKNRHFCNVCSAYKMRFLLKNQHKKEYNVQDLVWYSFLEKDHFSLPKIYNNMLRRYATSNLAQKVNVINIYDNKTNQLVQTFKNI